MSGQSAPSAAGERGEQRGAGAEPAEEDTGGGDAASRLLRYKLNPGKPSPPSSLTPKRVMIIIVVDYIIGHVHQWWSTVLVLLVPDSSLVWGV